MNLGSVKDHDIDAFGDAYEYLMTMYASNAGKSGGEFFTPADVSELLTRLGTVGKKTINKVYDPACGSGNFLTETYLSLRRLENKCIRILLDSDKKQISGQASFVLEGMKNPIKVSITQFYGIEVNDFAVTVAKTALWIAESQMLQETESIIYQHIDFLPLTTNASIIEANAITTDWNTVIPAEKLSYIMGNPPFSGARVMNAEQKQDIHLVFSGYKNIGNLDYVTCWYKKASDYIAHTNIHVGFVSTNSITQGESVGNLWKPLFSEGVHIDYAYRTFQWDSEAKIKAHVYCVIIGFSLVQEHRKKYLFFENGERKEVENINGYLLDGENSCVESRSTPLCDIPLIGMGNQPIDNGYYLFTKEEKDDFVKKEPKSEKYFHPWYGAQELIHNKMRYCLWLGECSPAELKSMPKCLERVKAVREYRLKSNRKSTIKLADSPTHFQTENMPKGTYIVIPSTSSQNRRYIPMGFFDENTICSNATCIISGATIYHFGVLESNVHMAWMRTVCGRLKGDYRYSKDIVYNNFPWPTPTKEQKERIEKTAQGILDARALYPDSSLADLYDPLTMPTELQKAHTANDRAVMAAYGFSTKMTEPDCVAELMKMYQKLAENS